MLVNDGCCEIDVKLYVKIVVRFKVRLVGGIQRYGTSACTTVLRDVFIHKMVRLWIKIFSTTEMLKRMIYFRKFPYAIKRDKKEKERQH